MSSLKENNNILSRGKYCGSISIPFPTKRWFLRCCIPGSLLLLVTISVFVLKFVLYSDKIDLLIPAIVVGVLPLVIFVTILKGVSRIDFYENEIILMARLPLLNIWCKRCIKRANLSITVKKGLFNSTRLVFTDRTSSTIKLSITTNSGWSIDSIQNIKNYLTTGLEDESILLRDMSHGDYVGTLDAGDPPKYNAFISVLLFLLVAGALFMVYQSSPKAFWVSLAVVVFLVALYYSLFFKISRVIIYKNDLVFTKKNSQKNGAISGNYIIDSREASVREARGIFRARVLKIKGNSQLFTIRLSERNGWTNEQLDEIQESINRHNNT